MASTFSPLLRIELIGTGDQSGTWGSTTNVNLGTLIEQAIAGTAVVDVTVGDVTLSDFNGTTDQARCAALRITGNPGGSRNVIAPASSKLYVVANGSDAAVVLKSSTSTGISIPSGSVILAYYDPESVDFRFVGYPASSLNTPNTLVLRDASGNFSAGLITADLVGDVTGNVTGTLTGTIASSTVATTQAPGDSSTKVATTEFVNNVAGALGTMSTQNANSVAITGGSISGVAISSSTIGGLTVGTNASGNRTISAGTPAGGSNGDIWYRY